MALKMDRDVRRVTVVKSNSAAHDRRDYRFDDGDRYRDDEDRQPIKRVTVIQRDGRGRVIGHDTYGTSRHGKRSSRSLRPLERSLRQGLEFQSRVLEAYLGRHARSNEKRRDGWLMDMPRNVARAVRSAKPQRLFRIRSLTRDND